MSSFTGLIWLLWQTNDQINKINIFFYVIKWKLLKSIIWDQNYQKQGTKPKQNHKTGSILVWYYWVLVCTIGLSAACSFTVVSHLCFALPGNFKYENQNGINCFACYSGIVIIIMSKAAMPCYL